jgi:hypothetical protein
MVNKYLIPTTIRRGCRVTTKTLPQLEHLRHYSSAARKKTQLRGTRSPGKHMSDQCRKIPPGWLRFGTQVWAQEGSEGDCAWENEMYREERMIGRMKENLSMFVAARKIRR